MNDRRGRLLDRIYNLPNENFEAIALEVFDYQYNNNKVYKDYIDHLGIRPFDISYITQIPCLPIRFFKSLSIKSGRWDPLMTFESSGTTGLVKSKHHLRDLEIYRQASIKSFESVYGDIKDWCFLALLPHYLEREHSSLVQMVKMFIDISSYKQSGFYLDNMDDLVAQIQANQKDKIPTVLIGVSFALIDLAEMYKIDLSGITVMETGGMKGRRAEWDKATLHRYLISHLGVEKIHSEYGMTELLSQCYSTGDGLFQHSPTMRILTKEVSDPFSLAPNGKSGVVNVMDLANIDTCSFIETQDLGIIYDEEHFSLQGRLDHSDVRGCNLMGL